MLCALVSCWAPFLAAAWDADLYEIIRETDDRRIHASREISLTVRWLWDLSSWLSNSDWTVTTLSSVCTLRLPLPCLLFRTSPAACWCCSSSNLCSGTFVRCNLCIHTDFWSKFCLIYWTSSKLPHLLDTASKFALFLVSGFKDEKLIKSKPVAERENWNTQTLF